MRYRLRTLLLSATFGPPLLAALWLGYRSAPELLRDLENIRWSDFRELAILATGFTLLTTFAILTAALARRGGSSS